MGRYVDKNTFMPSTKLPQFRFYLHFLRMGHQNMTLSASDHQMPWAARATATRKHWHLFPESPQPSLCLHTRGNGSAWLESSVMAFCRKDYF